MMQRRRIDAGIDAAAREQRRQGRRKSERAGALGVIERLDAEPVARQHDAPGIALPDREREHAVEALDAARAPFGVSLEDDLGVALREEAVTLGRELAAQLAIIVDAAVEHDGEAKLRIDHRLLRCGSKIDDAQAPMAEGDAILHEGAARVRPARVHSLRHGCNATAGGASIEGHFTANAAHSSSGPEWSAPHGNACPAPHPTTHTR